VYFSLQSDRRPLLTEMLARTIVTDLIVLAAELQREPIPTVVLVDEFAATGAEHLARLFGRGRSAGISLLLATQELSDLTSAGSVGLRDQVIGNVETVIAYRQNVPDSAELLATIAGTSPTWVTTQQTGRGLLQGLPLGRTLRRREHEYDVHPSEIKRLKTGQALVVTPAAGHAPTVAWMCRSGGLSTLA
jgi:type IV secretory pathway TraG/TraD family ATPase VirD4